MKLQNVINTCSKQITSKYYFKCWRTSALFFSIFVTNDLQYLSYVRFDRVGQTLPDRTTAMLEPSRLWFCEVLAFLSTGIFLNTSAVWSLTLPRSLPSPENGFQLKTLFRKSGLKLSRIRRPTML